MLQLRIGELNMRVDMVTRPVSYFGRSKDIRMMRRALYGDERILLYTDNTMIVAAITAITAHRAPSRSLP
jgi:hypothetical protein